MDFLTAGPRQLNRVRSIIFMDKVVCGQPDGFEKVKFGTFKIDTIRELVTFQNLKNKIITVPIGKIVIAGV